MLSNCGNDTLDINLLVTLDIGAQLLEIGDDTRHRERILKRTRTFGLRTERTGLVDQDGLVIITDIDAHGARPVIAFVLQDGNGHIPILVPDAVLGRRLDPIDGRDNLPVAGRRDLHLPGADTGAEREGGLVHLDLGKSEIPFLFLAADHAEGSDRQKGHP